MTWSFHAQVGGLAYGLVVWAPSPDHTAALKAVRSLGAELISFEESEELEEGAVY